MLFDAVFFDKISELLTQMQPIMAQAQRQQTAMKNLQGHSVSAMQEMLSTVQFESAPIQGHSPNTLF